MTWCPRLKTDYTQTIRQRHSMLADSCVKPGKLDKDSDACKTQMTASKVCDASETTNWFFLQEQQNARVSNDCLKTDKFLQVCAGPDMRSPTSTQTGSNCQPVMTRCLAIADLLKYHIAGMGLILITYCHMCDSYHVLPFDKLTAQCAMHIVHVQLIPRWQAADQEAASSLSTCANYSWSKLHSMCSRLSTSIDQKMRTRFQAYSNTPMGHLPLSSRNKLSIYSHP